MRVYVLTEESGEYSDWACVVVGVFTSPVLASEYVRRRARTKARGPLGHEEPRPGIAQSWHEGEVIEEEADALDEDGKWLEADWLPTRSWFLYPFETDAPRRSK